MKSNVKLITVGAVTLALTAVLGLLPYVFLIPLLFTCVTRGWRMTFFESLCFGVLSLLYAFMSPASFVAAAFIANPWIPIIPRIVAGLGCHATYVGLRRVCKGESKFMRALPVVAAYRHSCALPYVARRYAFRNIRNDSRYSFNRNFDFGGNRTCRCGERGAVARFRGGKSVAA